MKLFRILTMTAVAAGLVLAQGPGRQRGSGGTPPDPAQMIERRVEMMAKALGLSDDQKTQVTRILTEAETASQSVRTTTQTDHPLLEAAIKSNDLAAIDRLSAALGAASGQLTAIQSKASAAIYALLTPDQKAKYDEMPRGFMGGPMGGPGPMGGGPRPMGGPGRPGRNFPQQ